MVQKIKVVLHVPPTPTFFCKSMIPFELPRIIVQEYDSKGFAAEILGHGRFDKLCRPCGAFP